MGTGRSNDLMTMDIMMISHDELIRQKMYSIAMAL